KSEEKPQRATEDPAPPVTWSQVQSLPAYAPAAIQAQQETKSPQNTVDWVNKSGTITDVALGGIIVSPPGRSVKPPGRDYDDPVRIGAYAPSYTSYGKPMLVLHFRERIDRGKSIRFKA